MRAVTSVAVREARLKEIKSEIVNSHKLKVIFIFSSAYETYDFSVMQTCA